MCTEGATIHGTQPTGTQPTPQIYKQLLYEWVWCQHQLVLKMTQYDVHDAEIFIIVIL